MMTLILAVLLPWTTLKGMPYKGLVPLAGLSAPQSGWTLTEAPMWAMMAAEFAATGALLMFWFQG